MFKLFGRDVLNIFCDASIKKTNSGRTYGCPGSIAVDTTGSSVDYRHTILVDSTNNESEITAIVMAIQQNIEYKNMYPIINIFSDSKISVNGLRDWMLNWISNSKDGVLMSTSGEVANQQIFLHALNLIMYNLDSFRLYHVDGHKNPENPSQVNKVINDFERFNGIKIGPIEAKYLCYYNGVIDNKTRDELDLVNLNELHRLNPVFNYPIPSLYDAKTVYREIFDN